jgi:hypothetical protein
MKIFNLSENQAGLVIKSLRERLSDFDDELEILEGRIKEIISKRKEITEIITGLWSNDATSGPKKRGRKPGSGKIAQAIEAIGEVIAPKKRGRKPGSKNKPKAASTAPKAAPKKRGRKPKVAAAAPATPVVVSEPKKRGRKPKAKLAQVAAPKKEGKKRGRKPGKKKVTAAPVEIKSVAKTEKKVSSVKAKTKKRATAKAKAPKPAKAAKAVKPEVKKVVKPKAAATKKAEAKSNGAKKSSGSNGITLAAKILTVIEKSGKALNTNEVMESIISQYGPVDDKRKFMQAISSTLIGMAKRGKIIREDIGNKQFVNKLA